MSRLQRGMIAALVGTFIGGTLALAMVPTDIGRPPPATSSIATSSSSSSSTTGAPVALPPRPVPTAVSRNEEHRPPPASRATAAPGGTYSASASWYAAGLARPDALTFASRFLAKGTRVRFHYRGRVVVAVCNDYGPAAWTGRQFDLSRGAFSALAPLSSGVIALTWELV